MFTYFKSLIILCSFLFALSAAHAVSGESLLLLSYCKNPSGCGSRAAENVNFLKLQCEATVQAQKCDQLVKKNPELAPLMRKCDTGSLCAQNQDYVEQKSLACYRGYVNAAIDTGAGLRDMAFGLAYQIGKSYDAALLKKENRDKAIALCDLSCKRNLIKDNPRYKNLSDEQLEKASAKVLFLFKDEQDGFVKNQERISYKPNAQEDLRARALGEEKSRQLDPDSERKKDVLVAMLKNKLKSEYNKYLCYNPLAREELECYAIGGVVDPVALAGYFFKATRAMSAARAARELESVTVTANKASQRAEDLVEAAIPNKRSAANGASVPEFTKVSRLSPPSTIANMPSSLRLEKVERRDGSSFVQYSFAEKLKDTTWVRTPKELPFDSMTGAIDARFTGGRDFLRQIVSAKAGQAHMAFIDVGSLRAVNKTFENGMAQGDRYLKAVAEAVMKNGEGKVSLARWGGDEFALVIDSADPKKVQAILENIQKEIRKIDGEAHQVFKDQKLVLKEKYQAEAKEMAAQNPDGKLTEANKAKLREGLDELAKIQQPDISIGSAQIGRHDDLQGLFEASEKQAKEMKIDTAVNFGRDPKKYQSEAKALSRPNPRYLASVRPPAVSPSWRSAAQTTEKIDQEALRSMRLTRQDEVARFGNVTLARYQDELGRDVYKSERYLTDPVTGEKERISTEIPTRDATGLLDGMHIESQKMVMEHIRSNANGLLVMPKLSSLRYLNYFEGGTKAGDEMLAAVAKSLKETLRSNDLTFKLNGNEFLMSLKKSDPAAVQRISQKVNEAIMKNPQVIAILNRQRSVVTDLLQKAVRSGNAGEVLKAQKKLEELNNYKPDLNFETLSAQEARSKSFDEVIQTFEKKFDSRH